SWLRRPAVWLTLGGLLLLFVPVTLVLLLAVIEGDAYVSMPWGGQVPQDVSPANGIPATFVRDVQMASAIYHVPMQYLAGEVMEESAWNPNSYADYAGSHAMGLMQFEPETWSGGSDPYCRIDEPDTDVQRIQQYGGYGVDADGMWAPVGTPSRAAGQIAALDAQCRANGNAGCAPYASPWDPADAIMAAAHYLSALYHEYHTWPGASAAYYGGPGADAYVASVMRYTYAYILDTPPVALSGGGYWPFGGGVNFKVSPSGAGWLSLQAQSGSVVASQYLSSLPLIAPASGQATWRTSGGVATITLPLPDGEVLTLRVSNGGAIKWALPEDAETAAVSAGDVVGFVDGRDGFEVSGNIASLLPGGAVQSGILRPPGHVVGRANGGGRG
ncbi:MAG: transglycosylase SLT domain-containing protein, partial [Alicyclobacillus sp.]|nr:transglycosylase SLT domain-containing protein [Alicyclobacillus sp.]